MPTRIKQEVSFLEGSRGKLLIALYVAFLVALGIGGYFMGRDKVIARTIVQLNAPITQQMPITTFGTKSSDTQAGTIRFTFSLEIAERDTKRLEGYTPKIMDRIQTILNDTPPKQLNSPSGLELFRENLLNQINRVSGPVNVSNIYFQKLIAPQ
jgi:flagellar basal body-associated protein FliL